LLFLGQSKGYGAVWWDKETDGPCNMSIFCWFQAVIYWLICHDRHLLISFGIAQYPQFFRCKKSKHLKHLLQIITFYQSFVELEKEVELVGHCLLEVEVLEEVTAWSHSEDYFWWARLFWRLILTDFQRIILPRFHKYQPQQVYN